MSPVSHQASTSFVHHPLSGPSASTAQASGSSLGAYAIEDPLETRAMNISLEIAAALGHGQSEHRNIAQHSQHNFSFGALQNPNLNETDIRTVAEVGPSQLAEQFRRMGEEGGEEDAEGEIDDDPGGAGEGLASEGEGFPEPLRVRKGKEKNTGPKRKR